MDWLNLHTSTLDSPQFLGCEPTDRATWLCLLRYCAGQENGGVIADCAGWADRKWQQLARVTYGEVKRPCELWHWKGNSLHVWAYPTDKEALVKKLRGNSKVAAKARWKSHGRNGKPPGPRDPQGATGRPLKRDNKTTAPIVNQAPNGHDE